MAILSYFIDLYNIYDLSPSRSTALYEIYNTDYLSKKLFMIFDISVLFLILTTNFRNARKTAAKYIFQPTVSFVLGDMYIHIR